MITIKWMFINRINNFTEKDKIYYIIKCYECYYKCDTTHLKPILMKSVIPSDLVFKIGKFGRIGLHTSVIS